jgi:hypothetical protein
MVRPDFFMTCFAGPPLGENQKMKKNIKFYFLAFREPAAVQSPQNEKQIKINFYFYPARRPGGPRKLLLKFKFECLHSLVPLAKNRWSWYCQGPGKPPIV